jgi:hypothetical protein
MLAQLRRLLVVELDPSGNAEEDAEAPVRAGLELECTGEWPYEESVFAAL